MRPDSGATYPGHSASADCTKPPHKVLLVLTPEDSLSDLMESAYLIFPQTQDFVMKAGHCGQGPG